MQENFQIVLEITQKIGYYIYWFKFVLLKGHEMNFKKILAVLFAALICMSVFSACDFTDNDSDNETSSSSSSSGGSSDSTEAERFDYFNEDMTKYISVDESLYRSPKVTLPTYLNGSEGAVAEYITVLCAQYPVSTGNKITDRAIKNGDVVALYYEGWLNGEKFEGGSNMDSATAHSLEIGSGSFIPGFEEALIGIIPAETGRENLKDLNVTFPEDYHSADLAGKSVIFKVYVEYIDEKKPSDYTEEFITKTLGYTTKDTDVKASFEKYLKEEYLPSMKNNEILNSVWADLSEKAVITSYPQSELDYFYSSYETQYKQYYQYYSSMFSNKEDFMKAYFGANWKETLEKQCKVDVTQNLIFHYIAQKRGFIITDNDYNAAVNYYIDYYAAQGQTLTATEVEKYIGSRMIKEQALWDKVNAFIAENCTVTYE